MNIDKEIKFPKKARYKRFEGKKYAKDDFKNGEIIEYQRRCKGLAQLNSDYEKIAIYKSMDTGKTHFVHISELGKIKEN